MLLPGCKNAHSHRGRHHSVRATNAQELLAATSLTIRLYTGSVAVYCPDVRMAGVLERRTLGVARETAVRAASWFHAACATTMADSRSGTPGSAYQPDGTVEAAVEIVAFVGNRSHNNRASHPRHGAQHGRSESPGHPQCSGEFMQLLQLLLDYGSTLEDPAGREAFINQLISEGVNRHDTNIISACIHHVFLENDPGQRQLHIDELVRILEEYDESTPSC